MENKLSDIKIVIGLGNPEPSYKNTYHNAGKLMADRLLEKFHDEGLTEAKNFRKKIFGKFESCKAGGLALVKPTNYMNENGKAAKAALKSFGAKPGSLLVAHDDSDIEIGKYKVSFGSGSAGHKGVQSVIDNIASKDFWRLRIGVGKPEKTSKVKAGEFVLKKISGEDKRLMNSAFDAAIAEIFGDNAS